MTSPRSRIVLGALIVAVLCGAAWLIFRRPAAIDPTPRVALKIDEGSARMAGKPEPHAASRPVASVPFDPSREREEESAAASRSAIDRDHDLHGRVWNPESRPVAGARVVVEHIEARGVTMLDVAYTNAKRVVAETKTDAEGEFRVRLERGRRYELVVSADGLGTETVRDRNAGEYVDVRLQPGAKLVGRATRASDGSPVEGAKLRGWRLDDMATVLLGATDADGAFAFDSLTPGKITLALSPPVEKDPAWREIDLKPGAVERADFVVESGMTIKGRVTDAATGAAIQDAEVGESWVFNHAVRTDADGRYALRGFGGRGEIHARAKGYGSLGRGVPKTPGDPMIDFALTPGRIARGRIVDASGKAVAAAYVAAPGSKHADGVSMSDWPSTRSDAEGRFEVRDLRRDLRHALCVRKQGFASLLYDFPFSEAEVEVVEFGDVVLPLGASIAGVVVDEHDRPLPDAGVTLKGFNADRGKYAGRVEGKEGFPEQGGTLYGPYLSAQTHRADDLGRFRFADVAPGEYDLSYISRRGEADPPTKVPVAAGQAVEGFRLVVVIGKPIAGKVVDPTGAAVARVTVSAKRDGAGEEAKVLYTKTGADGAFRLERAQDGLYTVRVRVRENLIVPPRGFASMRTTGVPAGKTDLVLTVQPALPVKGRVLNDAGEPVAKALVSAVEADGETVAELTTLDDGTFVVETKAGDVVKLTAVAPTWSAANPPQLQGWHGDGNTVEAVSAGTSGLEIRLTKPK
jgi:protocatechuate 3,4-dioxygenase beta subunit